MRSLANLFLFFFAAQVCCAQTPFLDSLKGELRKENSDTVKCRLLYLLVEGENDETLWPKFNDELRRLCEARLKGVDRPRNRIDSTFIYYLSMASNNKGFEFQNKANYPAAIAEFNKAILWGKKIDDHENLSMTYNNMGGIYAEQKEFLVALDYFFRSMESRKMRGDKAGLGQSYLNIASVFSNMGENDSSRKYMQLCLKLSLETAQMDRVAIAYSNLGEELRARKEPEKAIPLLLRSSVISDSLHNKRGLTVVYGNLAEAYRDMKKFDLSKKYVLKALEYALEIDYPVHIRNHALTLYELERKEGNWQLALNYYIQFTEAGKKLENEMNRRASLKQQMQFEFDKQKAVDHATHLQELQISSEREQKQKIVSIGIGVVLLLVAVFAILLFKRLRITDKQKKIIAEQKHLVEEKQKEMLDSITYAKRIQNAHMPSEKMIERVFWKLRRD